MFLLKELSQDMLCYFLHTQNYFYIERNLKIQKRYKDNNKLKRNKDG